MVKVIGGLHTINTCISVLIIRIADVRCSAALGVFFRFTIRKTKIKAEFLKGTIVSVVMENMVVWRPRKLLVRCNKVTGKPRDGILQICNGGESFPCYILIVDIIVVRTRLHKAVQNDVVVECKGLFFISVVARLLETVFLFNRLDFLSVVSVVNDCPSESAEESEGVYLRMMGSLWRMATATIHDIHIDR